MNTLVFNCGSSSIKYQLFSMPDETVLAKGRVERIGDAPSEAAQTTPHGDIRLTRPIPDHTAGLAAIRVMLTDKEKGAVRSLEEIGAAGHRVVHGGEAFDRSVLLDEKTIGIIEDFCALAPLHNPPNLAGIREARRLLGDGVPQTASFDTAFHQTLPPAAYRYALPEALYEKFRIRRYGFHGTSHRFVARRAAELMGRGKYEVDLITCHLGNGSSMTAVRNGRSVDTSMGLSPLEGLAMGTRTGDLDPAIVFHLVRQGYSVQELDEMFNREAGLLGIAGQSGDMRDLEARERAGDSRAALALDVFAYRARKYIGAYLATLNGADAIVFTGGVGEKGPEMRQRILENMEGLGIALDPDANAATAGREGAIHRADACVHVFVIPTNEELAIARDTYALAV